MDLFRHSAMKRDLHKPLAERMRPTCLGEVVGQEHLLRRGSLLASVAQGGTLPSLILWGPPGTGKTTLARLLADRQETVLETVSAVTAGVKEIRSIAEQAADRRDQFRRRTVLFLDEIHRFSKAQQDALLPHVEDGTITLIGATTQNPHFEVNQALLSRCKLLRLLPLSAAALQTLARRALQDKTRGLGNYDLQMSDEMALLLVERTGGDARALLGALELIATIAKGRDKKAVDEDMVNEALASKSLRYDKSGDEHYGVVSAFIKSMRGCDADAACYWMVRMLEGGEDPSFILRRMVIFASEDIGNADPQALVVANAAQQAVQFVGLPEGRFALTQAVTYLANAPKCTNAYLAYKKAQSLVQDHGFLPVPTHLQPHGTKFVGEKPSFFPDGLKLAKAVSKEL